MRRKEDLGSCDSVPINKILVLTHDCRCFCISLEDRIVFDGAACRDTSELSKFLAGLMFYEAPSHGWESNPWLCGLPGTRSF